MGEGESDVVPSNDLAPHDVTDIDMSKPKHPSKKPKIDDTVPEEAPSGDHDSGGNLSNLREQEGHGKKEETDEKYKTPISSPENKGLRMDKTPDGSCSPKSLSPQKADQKTSHSRDVDAFKNAKTTPNSGSSAGGVGSNYVFGSAFSGETFSTIKRTAESPDVFSGSPDHRPNINLKDLLKIPAIKFDSSYSKDGNLSKDTKDDKDSTDPLKQTKDKNEDGVLRETFAEDNEFTKLKMQANLYLWNVDACEWSERGGVSVEISTPDNAVKDACIVIRSLGTRRILQNTRLFKEMKHKVMPPKHVTFIGTDMNRKLSKFLLKMKSKSDAELFVQQVDDILASFP